MLSYCLKRKLIPPDVRRLCGSIDPSWGQCRRVCKVLKSESWRQRARFSVAPCDRKAQKIPSTTVIGGNLPAEVLKILDKGPKYSYEPAPSRHQYLAMVRDVAKPRGRRQP
ncbi:hypothetical protein HPB52_020029 [Rhipicephalus sanguineus]|uniref:Uncharacterized protein n=1 Tax=Rhipicephalus sanguineus TaxID=34632 RepID=A0A9D4PGB8_RHISA|nr:hypothetical protein HPB52_020029 [Rhipicephalus sanguineus]